MRKTIREMTIKSWNYCLKWKNNFSSAIKIDENYQKKSLKSWRINEETNLWRPHFTWKNNHVWKNYLKRVKVSFYVLSCLIALRKVDNFWFFQIGIQKVLKSRIKFFFSKTCWFQQLARNLVSYDQVSRSSSLSRQPVFYDFLKFCSWLLTPFETFWLSYCFVPSNLWYLLHRFCPSSFN